MNRHAEIGEHRVHQHLDGHVYTMGENQEVKPPRRWTHSAEFKKQLVQASLQPGMSLAAVALHYRLNANLVRRRVIAHEEAEAAAQARKAMILPSAEFVPLQFNAPQATAEMQDIVIQSPARCRDHHAALAAIGGS